MATDGLGFDERGKAVAYVYVSDRERALGFYRDALGLQVVDSDPYGDFLALPGALLRLVTLPDVAPHPHPVFGLDVPDVGATGEALRARGVAFELYEGMGQDEFGVSTLPDGGKLAFFKDPDGNVLTLSQT